MAPLLDYPVQVSELEKIARLSPPPPTVERAPPGLAGADAAVACLVCGSRPARACVVCGGVSYCGEAHQRVDARWHDLVCADLRTIAQDAVFAARGSLVDALIDRIGRARIDDLAGWDDLLEADIVGARRRLLTDLGTRPLTLARALADLDIPARAARSGVISIHVMAADEREQRLPPALWATLARLFPGTRFELALVGPMLDDSRVPESKPADSPLTLRAHTGLYRRSLWRELGRPDLVLGYDCGLTLYPSWKPTILELRGSGVPFVVTSYRSWEAAAEARLLTAVGVTRVLGPAPNPFASLASQRSSTIANDVARDNAWVTVWR
ncbi:zinc finger MYND domain-containing protein [Enhygromyxa salina]|nr:zinc finger MYND domain-containing protein [Enhygromyxa salina]